MWSRLSRSGGNKPHPVILLLVAVLSLGTAAATPADDVPGGSLKQMLEWLDANHPELAAVRLEQDAAKARVQPAGALPDPMFSVEWRDIRYDSPTLDPTQVGAMRYQIRQSIPLWGKRELRSQVAEAGVAIMAAQQGQTRLVLHRQLKRMHATWIAARAKVQLLREQQPWLEDAERLARTRYAAGLIDQVEVLRAQTELAALQNDQVQAEAEVRRAMARLNAALLRPADAPLAEPAGFASLPTEIDWARLQQRLLEANPQLQRAAAEVDASTRKAELTRRNRWPDLTVGVAPMQKGSRFDTWELMLEINLPLQQESRRNQERETEHLRASAAARQTALQASLQGDLGELRAEYETALHHAQVLEDTVLPQIELSLRSAQAAYASGAGDFALVIEMQQTLRRTRLDAINASRDARLALAEIELRVGESL